MTLQRVSRVLNGEKKVSWRLIRKGRCENKAFKSIRINSTCILILLVIIIAIIILMKNDIRLCGIGTFRLVLLLVVVVIVSYSPASAGEAIWGLCKDIDRARELEKSYVYLW